MLVGHEVVVEALLVTSLVEVNARDEYGRTSLSWAMGEGHEGIVRLLLDTGQVNAGLQGSQTISAGEGGVGLQLLQGCVELSR